MSIFRRQGDVHETSAAPVAEALAQGDPQDAAKLMPPFMAPAAPRGAATAGVVPPPAAPLYSTRPEPTPHLHDTERSVAEQLGMAREALERAQVSIEGNVHVAAQRATRTESVASYDRRRTTPHGVRPPRPHHPFDPVAAAPAGLLNLAWRWQAAGSPIRAIHTYMQLLARYPHSAAAAAAVADLVELSGKLAEQGHFHIALSIYEEMEDLDQMCSEW